MVNKSWSRFLNVSRRWCVACDMYNTLATQRMEDKITLRNFIVNESTHAYSPDMTDSMSMLSSDRVE